MKNEIVEDTYIEFEMNFLSSTDFEFENREKFFPLAMYKIETKKFWNCILFHILNFRSYTHYTKPSPQAEARI